MDGYVACIPLSDSDKQDYNICSPPGNGSWTQIMRLRKVNGGWEDAFQIMRNIPPNGKTPWTQKQILSRKQNISQLKSGPIGKRLRHVGCESYKADVFEPRGHPEV